MSEPVPSITSAPEPLAVDQARRTRSYLIQMSIRVACIVGAILVDGWVRWAFIAAAVVLPYSAVLIANSGREQVSYDTSPVTPEAARAITELPDAPDGHDEQGEQDGPGRPDDAASTGSVGSVGATPARDRVIDHEDD